MMFRYLLVMGMMLASTMAWAGYTLPADLAQSPFNCSVTTAGTYQCPASIVLADGQQLQLTQDVSLVVNGDFRMGKDGSVTGGFNLNIEATGNIDIGDNSLFVGSLTAGNAIEIGENALIRGALNAVDKVEIKEDTVIYGNVVSGGKLELDKKAVVYGTCTPSHPQCLNAPSGTCGLIGISEAVYAAAGVEIKDSPTFNGNTLVSGKYGPDAVLPLGTVQPLTGQPRTLAGIDPAMLPPNPSTVRYTLSDGERLAPAADAYYDQVTAAGSVQAALGGAGNFHITKLEVKDDAVLSLEPGNYYINELSIKDNGRLVVTGPNVNLYIGKKVKLKKNAWLGGNQLTWLRIYGLSGSDKIEFKDDSAFRGLILAPYGTDISAKDRANLHAALLTSGKVKLEKTAQLGLTAAEAAAVSSTTTCPSNGIDHFDIQVGAGNGSTCSPLGFRITAVDNAGNPVPDYAGTVEITSSSGHGSFATVSASNPLSPNPDTDDNGRVGYVFSVADGGQISLALNDPHAETLTLTVRDSALAVSSTSLPVTFRDNAFVIEDVDAGVAGVNVPVAGRDHAYRIRMLRKDPVSGVCAVATGYQGSMPLKLWRVKNIADPSPNAPSLAAVTLPAAEPAVANAQVTFTAGEATVLLHSTDIGKFTLEAKDSSRSFADIDIAGGSAEQILRPFGIGMDFSGQRSADFADNGRIDDSTGTDRSWAADATGSVFTQAGADFPMTLSGVLWQARDDADNDGLPDAGAYLGDNPVAPSFGAEGESVVIQASVRAPTGATARPLVVNGVAGGPFNAFSGGAQTANVRYGNVGIIDIQARLSDNDYFGSGVGISGVALQVGRFNPWQYAVTASSVIPACSSGLAFTYAREPFLAQVTLEAQNRDGQRTDGYRAGFVTLDLATELNIVNDQTSLPYDLESYSVIESFDTAVAGETRFDLHLAWNMPLQAPMVSQAQLIDTRDEVTRVAGSPVALGQTEVRFGRMALMNSHGSELLSLPIPMRAEYYDGANFRINRDDGCSRFGIGQVVLDSAIESAQTDGDIQVLNGQLSRIAIAHDPLANGEAGLSLCPPGNPACTPTPGNEGWVNLRLDLALRPWLRFDWNGDGRHDNDPTARATFGIYKGNERQIHLRRLFE